MSKHDDLVYIRHILDAIGKIQKYTDPLDQDAFMESDMEQDAVIRQFEIIGEAAKQVSIPFREANKDIPWSKMAKMRDKLIHRYFEVDIELVWKTIKEDLPGLDPLLRALVSGRSS